MLQDSLVLCVVVCRINLSHSSGLNAVALGDFKPVAKYPFIAIELTALGNINTNSLDLGSNLPDRLPGFQTGQRERFFVALAPLAL
ncbi:hypothetical protein WICPIJ_000981 [Wickerhamomyces pijperi]|uniref:Uncharacterized protein n=1 Tax=Wickerhamomyces pijperi TaxID=599730 RepID=A0A9P8QEN2_WICPI|nr:hypothetical protein WICPIJ_000981 [Wickerhamomyces pijperi]